MKKTIVNWLKWQCIEFLMQPVFDPIWDDNLLWYLVSRER
jgi:hypothetical protein